MPVSKRRKKKVVRRQPSHRKRDVARGNAAETRGQRLKPTIADYERVAQFGGGRVVEGLISRHNSRMVRLSRLDEGFAAQCMEVLVSLPLLDKTLQRYGARLSRLPADYSGSWPDHVSWGISSVVSAVRLLMSGQFVGAAVIARHQLERWTMHRAFNWNIKQGSESTVDFMARVWSTPNQMGPNPEDGVANDDVFPSTERFIDTDDPSIDHRHVVLSDGHEVCAAVMYGYLSEMLHARELERALNWDSRDLHTQKTKLDGEVHIAVSVITDTLFLVVKQLRIACLTLAQEKGDMRTLAALASIGDRYSNADSGEQVDRVSRGRQLKRPPLLSLMPLLPEEGLSPFVVAALRDANARYLYASDGFRFNGELLRDDEFVSLFFMHKRHLSVRGAKESLAHEKKMVGDTFDLDSISGRVSRWLIVGEAAGLIGTWTESNYVDVAFAAISSGLRSAFWLWLEDDDRSMSVLRSVFEQCARVRVWRRKPDKAARLEKSLQTTPRDWIEAAGWRRLAALNRALGEFAHVNPRSKWSAARELLAELQVGADDDTAIYTARRESLDLVARLVAEEVIEWCRPLSEPVANALSTEFDKLGVRVTGPHYEEVLNHIHSFKGAVLMEPEFVSSSHSARTGPQRALASEDTDRSAGAAEPRS